MGKYCRWCGYCIDNGYNDYYCTKKEKFLSTATVKSYNCKDFGDCESDIITGKDRTERKLSTRIKKVNDGEQITILCGIHNRPPMGDRDSRKKRGE